MTFGRILTVLILTTLGVYLFVTAPPPLPIGEAVIGKAAMIDSVRMLRTINAVNALTRKLYTERIVGAGQIAGLQFREDWKQVGVEAGPLPALFLRLVAEKLQQKKPQLGLFLGSDKPINPSNLFTGRQETEFIQIRATGAPRYFAMADGSQVAMFPDVASGIPCVSCHNKHKRTPKRDWKLNDIMGATTWVYDAPLVTPDDYRLLMGNLYAAIEETYGDYLRKAATFKKPPNVTSEWPTRAKRVLPDAKTMMEAVYAVTSGVALNELLVIGAPKQNLTPH